MTPRTDTVLPADWNCPVCSAGHAGPSLRCRRCGCGLVAFARLNAAARMLGQAGRPAEADALARPPATSC